MHKFKKLKIWQESIKLVKNIYELTKSFPQEELFGLTSQLRRATVSINLNIAEGSASKSDMEFRRFLIMSLKSVYEVVAILEIAKELNYIQDDNLKQLMIDINNIGAMVNALINKLSNKKSNS